MNAKQEGLIDSIGTTSHNVGLLTEVIMTGAFSNPFAPFNHAEEAAEKRQLQRTADEIIKGNVLSSSLV